MVAGQVGTGTGSKTPQGTKVPRSQELQAGHRGAPDATPPKIAWSWGVESLARYIVLASTNAAHSKYCDDARLPPHHGGRTTVTQIIIRTGTCREHLDTTTVLYPVPQMVSYDVLVPTVYIVPDIGVPGYDAGRLAEVGERST